MTKTTTMTKTRKQELLSALRAHDHGDGCLGIIIDDGLRRNPDVTAEELREVCIEAEAEADAKLERERENTPAAKAGTLYLSDTAEKRTAEQLGITEEEYAELCEESETSAQPEGHVRTSTGIRVYAL